MIKKLEILVATAAIASLTPAMWQAVSEGQTIAKSGYFQTSLLFIILLALMQLHSRLDSLE